MVLIQDLVMFLDTERWVSKMGWEDILKGKVMSDRAKSLIDDVMSSEKLTTEEIREKMMQSLELFNLSTTNMPTSAEMARYLNKNYSSERVRRTHPITEKREYKKVYFKEE